MATKRFAPSSVSSTAAPIGTAVWLVVALCYGFGTLVANGRMEWPPTHLLSSLYTVAGCLAMVGPIVLFRKQAGEAGLGDLIWMVGGFLVWMFDGLALARGEIRTLAWPTPLTYQPMGLTVLVVALAAWRCRLGAPSWSWTNVTGWGLGFFWVAMAATSLIPPKTLGFALR